MNKVYVDKHHKDFGNKLLRRRGDLDSQLVSNDSFSSLHFKISGNILSAAHAGFLFQAVEDDQVDTQAHKDITNDGSNSIEEIADVFIHFSVCGVSNLASNKNTEHASTNVDI